MIEFIQKRLEKIKLFFTEIDYPTFKKSLIEVLWMTFFSVLPLLINITITYISTKSFPQAVKERIIPGEMLSYCLSFLAPSLYLLTKINGTKYRLPLLHIFTMFTYGTYAVTMVLYIIAKNKFVKEIDLGNHEWDVYFKTTLYFLLATVLLRIFSVYHGSNSTYSATRKKQQDDFNSNFSDSLN